LADWNRRASRCEALQSIVPLDFAGSFRNPDGHAPVDQESNRYKGQCQTYHRASSFPLPHHIDIQITSQMFVGVLTLKIGFTGIHMSIVTVVKVILRFVFGHDVTSLLVGLVKNGLCYKLNIMASSRIYNVSRLTVW
jgi:hypothetical protein